MTFSRLCMAAVMVVAFGLGVAACGRQEPEISSCGLADDVALPGAPARPWSSCAGIAGFAHANKAPLAKLHVGDTVALTDFAETPRSTDPHVLGVSINDGATSGIGGTITALRSGKADLMLESLSCLDGNAAPGSGCTVMRFQVLP